jgi:hypothetical protein
MVDDVYRGYRIPKGSTIIGNTWFVDIFRKLLAAQKF